MRQARQGPLPKGSDGVYFIDRDPVSFRYILNHLRDLQLAAADAAEPEPEPEGAEEARAEAPSMPLSVPDSVGDRAQLAREAKHYGLDELEQACSGGPAEVHSLASLVASSGPGVTVVDILALTADDLKTLLKELKVNIVLTARITAEVEAAAGEFTNEYVEVVAKLGNDPENLLPKFQAMVDRTTRRESRAPRTSSSGTCRT